MPLVAKPLSVLTTMALLVLFALPVAAQSSRDMAELSMRVDRLEAQIRDLTGQIERLTYSLQNGSSGAVGGAQPQNQTRDAVPSPSAPLGSAVQPQSNSGLGAPPRNLGTLSTAEGAPLDLSALIGATGGLGVEPVPPSSTQGAPATGASFGNSPRDEYELAYGYILRGDYETAEASLRQFLIDNPSDPLASDARFWLGESLFVRGNYRGAANEFLEAYSKFPGSAKAPDSLLKLGMSLRELGEKEAACATFAELVRKYPAASTPVKERVRDERRSARCI
uniref:tol-pal system protein YbgF n=1 Tax=Pararhizobium sp. IMCC3301 TaxID=3067904 RepID=UPI002740612F|nr:tol-pal system protein YbgF [Pararhizobium sp. IMCC3301]